MKCFFCRFYLLLTINTPDYLQNKTSRHVEVYFKGKVVRSLASAPARLTSNVYEFGFHGIFDDSRFIAAAQQFFDAGSALLTVVKGVVVDIHTDK